MKVRLINYTPNPIETIFTAARTCYSPDGPISIWKRTSDGEISQDKMFSLIDRVIASGHLSVLEHISFTFAIEGISRACSHQLVRHRIASFSQQSQRYVSAGKDFVIPDSISNDESAEKIFSDTLRTIEETYKKLVERGIPKEDARFILPNATQTKIVMTMNFRELYQVCQIRLCTRAQWEIRELFWKVKSEIKKVPQLAGLSEYLVPQCQILGYCPERKSCGLMPSRDEIEFVKKNIEGER